MADQLEFIFVKPKQRRSKTWSRKEDPEDDGTGNVLWKPELPGGRVLDECGTILPRGACELKERKCVNCDEKMMARYPKICKKCKRHAAQENDHDEFSVVYE